MNQTDSQARTRLGLIGVLGVAGVALAVALVLALGSGPDRTPANAGDGLNVALSVEPFEVGDSVPTAWDSAVFAESLAVRLSRVPGLHAVRSRQAGARYALHGTVTTKEGRLILATHLSRAGQRDTVWTTTFWRSAVASGTLVSDLATAVAEAVISSAVQESLAPRREKP